MKRIRPTVQRPEFRPVFRIFRKPNSFNLIKIVFLPLLLSLVMFVMVQRVKSSTIAPESEICPVCQTKFTSMMDMSGTQTGRRLDYKPIGSLSAPWRIPECPTCGFVIYKKSGQFTKEELVDLRRYVFSEEFKKIRSENSSYYLLAKITEFMDPESDAIGPLFLKASWQVENSPAKYHHYLECALEYYVKLTNRNKINSIRSVDLYCITGELYRLLSSFSNARSLFIKMKRIEIYKVQPYRTIIDYELKLIREGDHAPHEVPPIVNTEEDKKKTREYQMYSQMKGYDNLLRVFQITDAGIGQFLTVPGQSLRIELKCRMTNLIMNVTWWNPVPGFKPEYSWDDFSGIFEDLLRSAKNHVAILSNFSDIRRERSLCANISGITPNTESDQLYTFVGSAWRHADLRGEPLYKLYLMSKSNYYGILYFNDVEPKILVVSYKNPDRSYGPLEHDVFYHPTQLIPEYMVIDTNNKWITNRREVEMNSHFRYLNQKTIKITLFKDYEKILSTQTNPVTIKKMLNRVYFGKRTQLKHRDNNDFGLNFFDSSSSFGSWPLYFKKIDDEYYLLYLGYDFFTTKETYDYFWSFLK